MNKDIKEIREYIACPQFGDDHYGEWGALRLDQRIKIKQLLDYITNLQEENKRLKENPLRGMFANITDDELLIDMGYTNKENEELKQRIDKAIKLLEKEDYHCPMSLSVEKAYIIEVEKINNVISILKGENKPQYLGYSDKECINCGRLRVEKYSDGTEICEKCNFDQNKKEYV